MGNGALTHSQPSLTHSLAQSQKTIFYLTRHIHFHSLFVSVPLFAGVFHYVHLFQLFLAAAYGCRVSGSLYLSVCVCVCEAVCAFVSGLFGFVRMNERVQWERGRMHFQPKEMTEALTC